MNMQSDDVWRSVMMCDGSKDLRIEGTILLRIYLHKRFWIKKVLSNSRAHLRNKSGFLKYNYSLLENTVQ